MSSITSVRAPYLEETFIELYMNGLYTGLFFATIYSMLFKKPRRRTSYGLLVAITLMYILSTMHIICRWILLKNAFINHGDTALSTSIYLTQSPLWLVVLGAVVVTTNTLIADCVLIWRCWTIWNRSWIVVTLPILCTLSGAALGFKSVQEQAAFIINPNLNRDTFVDFATPYFSLSLATTCLATLLIVLRIVMMTSRKTRESNGYNWVIEIVVESALLYSVAMAVFLPFLNNGSFSDAYPQAVVTQMTGLAPTLIVARVTFGLARPDETWQGTISTIQLRNLGTAQHANTVGLDGTQALDGSEI